MASIASTANFTHDESRRKETLPYTIRHAYVIDDRNEHKATWLLTLLQSRDAPEDLLSSLLFMLCAVCFHTVPHSTRFPFICQAGF